MPNFSENHEEQAYLDLLAKVLFDGASKPDRTSVGSSKSLWWQSLQFDLSKGFPLYTSRQISFRIAFEEMMFFLRGETDTKKLEEKNINIWKDNTSRSFLDKAGLYYLPDGHMGKGYGFQLRNFGGDHMYDETPHKIGKDQLKHLISNIKMKPHDRRHIVSYWNPNQLHEAALVPCHIVYGCQVQGDRLNAGFTMRSNDLYLGNPTNVAGYAFLTHLIAALTGYKPGVLGFHGYDCHLYENSLDAAKTLIQRKPKPFPQFSFKKEITKQTALDEALMLSFEDIEIINYEHCGKMAKVDMAI